CIAPPATDICTLSLHDALPIYYAEGCLDNDNYDLEHHVKVCCKVIVDGDNMTIDLTGSNKATKGAVNCGFAQTIAAARVAFKELDRKSTRLNSSHVSISYAVFC